MRSTNIKKNLDELKTSDIYSLMLFILYKLKDVPEYAVLSELCYLLDGNSLIRTLTYFAGRTIKIPTESDFVVLSNALLLYQYINLDGLSLSDAQDKLVDLTKKQLTETTDLYLQIIPIMAQYNIDRGGIRHE